MWEKVLRVSSVVVILIGFSFIPRRYLSYPSPAQITAAKLHLQNLGTAMQMFYEKHGAYPTQAHSLAELQQVLSPFLKNAKVNQPALVSLKINRYEASEDGYKIEFRLKRAHLVLTEVGVSQ